MKLNKISLLTLVTGITTLTLGLSGCGGSGNGNTPIPFGSGFFNVTPVSGPVLVGTRVDKTDPNNDLATFSVATNGTQLSAPVSFSIKDGAGILQGIATSNGAVSPSANGFAFNQNLQTLYVFSKTGDSIVPMHLDPSTSDAPTQLLDQTQATAFFGNENNSIAGAFDAQGDVLLDISDHAGPLDTAPPGIFVFNINGDGTLTPQNQNVAPLAGDSANVISLPAGSGNPTAIFNANTLANQDAFIVITDGDTNNVQVYLEDNGQVVPSPTNALFTVPNVAGNHMAAGFLSGLLVVGGNGQANNVVDFTFGQDQQNGTFDLAQVSAITLPGVNGLQPVTPTVFTAQNPAQLFFEIVATTDATTDNIVVIPVIPDGTQTMDNPLPTPFSTSATEVPTGITVDPNGTFVFVTTPSSVTSFQSNADGTLTQGDSFTPGNTINTAFPFVLFK